ncbi:MAG: MBOAT family protein [Polyangiaceae bacterium]|nr:MBOAT family protein [Polyangiaceae bacterium]
MPFSSLLFLHGFLPLFLAAYWLTPRRFKNLTGIAGSLAFYAWGAPRFLPVVVLLGVGDYYLSHAIARRTALGTPDAAKAAKRLLVLGVFAHLVLLGYFKYSNFFMGQVNDALGHFGGRHLGWVAVVLPIGISFITFEEISYLTDVYRGDAKPARSLGHYLLFLTFFPHSIAGPIFRWKDLAAQLNARKQSFALVREGFARFSVGLAKKVLLADSIAIVADGVFGLPAAQLGTGLGWLGACAYTLQIYFDFSGYSDMAIGLGKMCGFTFKENFDMPYVAASITEFWQRWHISLSRWLRDYLYIPLGGNRRGEHRATLNVVIVFTLSGLWHGAAWSFVVWGLYHGLFVALERVTGSVRNRIPLPIRHVATMVIVIVGWVFFRATSLPSALHVLGAMAGRGQGAPLAVFPAELCPSFALFAMIVGALIVLYQLGIKYGPASPIEGGTPLRLPPWRVALSYAPGPVLFLASIAHLTNSRVAPLIYFKF